MSDMAVDRVGDQHAVVPPEAARLVQLPTRRLLRPLELALVAGGCHGVMEQQKKKRKTRRE